MHKYQFLLDGESSLDYGISLQKPLYFPKPSRRVNTIRIPGRNGELHLSEDSFSSVETTAQCFILQSDATEKTGFASMFLLGKSGERRMETPEDPDVYRLVTISAGFDMDVRADLLSVFNVGISARPERFLKSGEIQLSVTSGGILYNPGMTAYPLLEVNSSGNGSINISGVPINLSDAPEILYIDCDTQNAYDETGYQNNKIYTPNGFPILSPGLNEITFSGGVHYIKIMPRWWML